jgi:hypothetical protein
VQEKRHHLAALDVLVVVDSATDIEGLNRTVARTIRRPPLSKFGITGRVITLHLENVMDAAQPLGIEPDQTLWMYRTARLKYFTVKLRSATGCPR